MKCLIESNSFHRTCLSQGFEIIEASPTSSEQNDREQDDSDEEDTALPEGWEERVVGVSFFKIK